METIFVLVKVSYDYRRFQDNLGVFSSAEGAMEFALGQKSSWPVYFYNDNFHDEYDEKESPHFCVQEFSIV